ncbi:hypothetical protein EI94DRAFT_1032627 [Lactarius quietus]|nr:hypothetical protein EI94DRAFT_1032627 [Lactarius quietus]
MHLSKRAPSPCLHAQLPTLSLLCHRMVPFACAVYSRLTSLAFRLVLLLAQCRHLMYCSSYTPEAGFFPAYSISGPYCTRVCRVAYGSAGAEPVL